MEQLISDTGTIPYNKTPKSGHFLEGEVRRGTSFMYKSYNKYIYLKLLADPHSDLHYPPIHT